MPYDFTRPTRDTLTEAKRRIEQLENENRALKESLARECAKSRALQFSREAWTRSAALAGIRRPRGDA